jgi:uncharacterized protein (DUF1015 family)
MAQIAGFRGALLGEPARDTSRALYRYHQTFAHDGRSLTRKTMVCAVQLVPWTDGTVRPHEAVDPAARAAQLASISSSNIHVEPVLAGYRDAPNELDRLFRKAESERPTVELTTADGTIHCVWRVSSAEVIGKVRPLFAPKKLHVLDGHARYEAMLAHAATLGERSMYSSANYGLACLVNVDDPTLIVRARHRVVRGGGKPGSAVLDAAKLHFLVERLAGAAGDPGKLQAALGETVAHQPAFAAVFAGDVDAWKLTLRPDVSPVAEGVAIHRALQKLDPVVVEHLFVNRLVPGATSTAELDAARVIAAVGAGAELGIIMRPVPLDQILYADELGDLLPVGSTAFTPALNNLVAYVIDRDEDLV